ncbi:SDR family NAD(P)-dependent oxidoreductase [Oceanobacillus sp. J11TS1]|uniref:SDR family NAD(P)-dependent oxidoreductase n=1 Tax=Oceanobacillus sp. J11TS1 TaxID=2807191 RepID=UPI001B2D7896|nr:SDR family oxidoreductase [Oceanobacillus sp. J11TS1]GIO22101.1 oxidoreductase [Oceanobacillus sp. J11TS1]
MKLKGKVALITGSASGFGRAAAYLFAKEGASVVVADFNETNGQEVVKNIKNNGGEASFVHVDCSVVSDVEKMVKQAVQTYGKLDIFWHNAGDAGPGIISQVTEEQFDRTIAIHVKGGFFGAKFAIPEIQKSGGGSILFTTSPAGYKPSPGSPVYSMAKASLSMLTKSLAVQLGKEDIRVNCIAPGPVATGLWERFIDRNPDLTSSEEYERDVIAATVMGRMGKVEDIAHAALYLVSDEANFVTGTVIPVDGGYLAK